MKYKYIRIASVNARSIYKVSNNTKQRQYTNHLRSKTIAEDILCLQETSAFHSQEHLTEDQTKQFEFMFPGTQHVLTRHCAIISLNEKFTLINTSITRDERCIATTVVDNQNRTIYHIANIYAPATHKTNSHFSKTFPLFHSSTISTQNHGCS